MYGIDEEDLMGTDVSPQTRSYFMDLVSGENEELLEQFINNQEQKYFSEQRITRRAARVEEDNFEPEDAFMKIGFNLRQALKKHPPMGMLEVE